MLSRSTVATRPANDHSSHCRIWFNEGLWIIGAKRFLEFAERFIYVCALHVSGKLEK